jgi:chromosome segregation ATPase
MASTDPILKALQNLESNLVERLTTELNRRFDGFQLELNGRFDTIEQRLDRLEVEYQMISAALKRIEEQLETDASDRARMRLVVNELRSKVRDLDARIREIEARLADE